MHLDKVTAAETKPNEYKSVFKKIKILDESSPGVDKPEITTIEVVITGSGMNFKIPLNDDADWEILTAILKKVKLKLQLKGK